MSKVLYLLHRRIKDGSLSILKHAPFTANTITFTGIISSIVYIITFNPFFLLYSLLTDFIDGTIARLQKTATSANRIYDLGADMLRWLCVMLALNIHANLDITYTLIVMLHLLSKTVSVLKQPYLYIGKVSWGTAWIMYACAMLGYYNLIIYLSYILVLDTSLRFLKMLITR